MLINTIIIDIYIYFLGRVLDYAVAMEASLNLKEIYM